MLLVKKIRPGGCHPPQFDPCVYILYKYNITVVFTCFEKRGNNPLKWRNIDCVLFSSHNQKSGLFRVEHLIEHPQNFNALKNKGTFSAILPRYSTLARSTFAMTSTHNAPHCLPFTLRLRGDSGERGPLCKRNRKKTSSLANLSALKWHNGIFRDRKLANAYWRP